MKFMRLFKKIRIPIKDRHQIRLLYTLLAYLIFNFVVGPLTEKYAPMVGGHFTENVSHIILTVGAVFMGTLIDHTFLFDD
jgi:hypothetical protein